MTNENFSAEESLHLIQGMINKTRKNISDKSHYFLLWGWAAFLAMLGQFILMSVIHYRYHYQVWWVVVICSVITVYWMNQDDRKKRVTTYAGESMRYLWTALGISFFVLDLLFYRIGWLYCYPFFITLYGIGTFISGKILQFPLFTWGGIACWLIAIVSVWFPMDIQMLSAATAILLSYIIPGHMLRAKYKRERQGL